MEKQCQYLGSRQTLLAAELIAGLTTLTQAHLPRRLGRGPSPHPPWAAADKCI